MRAFASASASKTDRGQGAFASGTRPVAQRTLQKPLALQAKLTVGPAGDRYEQEADRIAESVMRMAGPAPAGDGTATPPIPGGRLQRKCTECKEEETRLQRKAAGNSSLETAPPPIVHDVLRSPGEPLDAGTRAYMEPRFGHDFGGVRVHADARAAESAAAVGARAYTVGHHLVFGAASYLPGSADGRRLIAHELTHTLQQGRGAPLVGRRLPAQEPARLVQQHGGARGEPAAQLSAVAGPVVQRTLLCSKPLEAPVVGWYARHAFVDDTPTPTCNNPGVTGNYAVTDLISGNFVRGCAVKTDASPDPRGKPIMSKPCRPKPGVADLHLCLRSAYTAYTDPSLYSNVAVTVGAGVGGVVGGVRGAIQGAELGSFFGIAGSIIGGIIGGGVGALRGARTGAGLTSRWNGPNSNTFAATLARACCDDSTDSGLGWVPGWAHAPAGPCTGTPGTSPATPTPTTAPTATGTPATPTVTTPRPYSGTVSGSFSFTYISGLPPTIPPVGARFPVHIGFLSNGVQCVTDVEFQVHSVAGRTVELWSTNTAPIDIAPAGDPPLIIRPNNVAHRTY
jgi:hypothetical protein